MKACVQTKTCTQMFMVVLLVIAKRWGEKPKGPSADKMDKMWYISI